LMPNVPEERRRMSSAGMSMRSSMVNDSELVI
jgi:hypothetical protein